MKTSEFLQDAYLILHKDGDSEDSTRMVKLRNLIVRVKEEESRQEHLTGSVEKVTKEQ